MILICDRVSPNTEPVDNVLVLDIGPAQATRTGGIVKAEGLGDGGWANHRQAALDTATRSAENPGTRDIVDPFEEFATTYE